MILIIVASLLFIITLLTFTFSCNNEKVDLIVINSKIYTVNQDDFIAKSIAVKNGKIISERYAEDYDKNSHGTSWSMAKSYYAALIGISIDKGEIKSLDDKVSDYLEYYNDERSKITLRDILDMSSGLDFPTHEHEKMFFQSDHLKYAKNVGVNM